MNKRARLNSAINGYQTKVSSCNFLVTVSKKISIRDIGMGE